MPAWLNRRTSAPRHRPDLPFTGSAAYWRARYAAGRSSGAGSAGVLADFKARVLNDFFAAHGVHSVIEFGCGDGAQLARLKVPAYTGVDVSPTALARCRQRCGDDPSRTFMLLDDYAGQRADVALSLDVLYHLVEDPVFDAHLRALFGAARRYVVIYSCDDDQPVPARDAHVRRRRFSPWIAAHAPAWKRIARIPNPHPWHGDVHTGSWSDFHIYAPAAGEATRGAK